MAEIDTSKRKPRRTAGTPSYHYRNKFAAAVIAGGFALFGILYYIPPINKASKKLLEYCMTENIEAKEHRALFSFITPKRGEDILKILEESEDIKKTR